MFQKYDDVCQNVQQTLLQVSGSPDYPTDPDQHDTLRWNLIFAVTLDYEATFF